MVALITPGATVRGLTRRGATVGMRFVERDEWGARPARAASTLAKTRGVKIHYTGSHENPKMREDHDRYCAARVRAIQDGHMDGRGWHDIAYTLIVCIHGVVYEGRGVHVLPAANGEGLNSGHYAVCALVGNSGLVHPSAALYDGLCDAITYLRDHGDAGREVLGHRDGYATDCPGDRLYTWVEQGAPCGVADNSGKDDDMPRHVKVGLGKAMPLPADQWTPINWRTEAHDPTHQHADAGGPSVLNGPATYGMTASLELIDLPAGTPYLLRTVEVDADGKDTPTIGPTLEGLAVEGGTSVVYSLGAGRVLEGRRVRLEVMPVGHPATAAAGSCELLYWR